jgi:hypothetical protein
MPFCGLQTGNFSKLIVLLRLVKICGYSVLVMLEV